MAYVIGTDEAGYGPNLGPLVISASVWHVPDGLRCEELYAALDPVVTPVPRRNADSGLLPVALADSKVLYHSGSGLQGLERGLWAAMSLLGRFPRRWREVWTALAPQCADELARHPEYADYDGPVPLDADAAELLRLATCFAQGLTQAGVRLVELRSRPVFPAEFNDLLDHYDSKGAALSHLTIELVAQTVQCLDAGPVSVVCDKHGGRDRYAGLVFHHFPDWFIEICAEGRAQSMYRFGPPERRIEIRFSAKAESHLPVALASMASKYLRELAMRAVNTFWCCRVPGLTPTAGYPQDARRFMDAIADARAALGIADRMLWRTK